MSKKNTRWKNNDDKANRNGPRSTIFFGNGKYTGNWKNNMRHAEGIQEFHDGCRYDGLWANDKANGHGLFYVPIDNQHPPTKNMKVVDGLVLRYNGEWKNDEMSGYGIYYYDDGSRYEGEWVSNTRHGVGTMYYTNGERYTGQWKQDIREGRGTLFKTDFSIIQGSFSHDLPHGHCVYFIPLRRRKYEGEFFEGIPKCGIYEESKGPFPQLLKTLDGEEEEVEEVYVYAPGTQEALNAHLEQSNLELSGEAGGEGEADGVTDEAGASSASSSSASASDENAAAAAEGEGEGEEGYNESKSDTYKGAAAAGGVGAGADGRAVGAGVGDGKKNLGSGKKKRTVTILPPIQILELLNADLIFENALRSRRLDYLARYYSDIDQERGLRDLENGTFDPARYRAEQMDSGKTKAVTTTRQRGPLGLTDVFFEGEGVVKHRKEINSHTIMTCYGPLGVKE